MFFFVFVFVFNKVFVFFSLADIIIYYTLFVLTEVVLRFFPLFNAFRKKRTRTALTILSC